MTTQTMKKVCFFILPPPLLRCVDVRILADVTMANGERREIFPPYLKFSFPSIKPFRETFMEPSVFRRPHYPPLSTHTYGAVYPVATRTPPPPLVQHTLTRSLCVFLMRFAFLFVEESDVQGWLDALARNWVKDRSPVKNFAWWFYPPSE